MRGRYPDQVGRHKPCVPVVEYGSLSPFGTVLPRRWSLVPLVGTGPPGLSPKGSWSEWPGEFHGSISVLSERHWSTRMGVRGHGFCGVGTVC